MPQLSVRQETTMEGAGTSRRTSIRKKFSQFKLVSLERSDFEEQQENSGKQDEEEDGILENDSPSDDDDIPSLEQEADFYLERGSRFGKSIRFNSRIVFS